MTSFPRETHGVISGPTKDKGFNQFVVKVKNDPENEIVNSQLVRKNHGELSVNNGYN
jgi:hypothetical protein